MATYRSVNSSNTPSLYDRDTTSVVNSGNSAVTDGATATTQYERRYEEQETLGDKIKNAISKVYDDLTGKSQTLLQNELEKERMELQYQYDLQAALNQYKIETEALESAGLNRNLVYNTGGTSVSQQAPKLEAYSGSSRVQRTLQGAMQLMQFIPGIYQAQAGIQKVLQEKIKTARDWLGLKNDSIDVADKEMERPITVSPTLFGNLSRKWKAKRGLYTGIVDGDYNGTGSYQSSMQKAYMADLEYRNLRSKGMSEDLAAKIASNIYDFGLSSEGGVVDASNSYYYTRNRQALNNLKQSELNYNVDVDTKEFSKWAGIFSPLIQSLLGQAGRLTATDMYINPRKYR